MKKHLATLLAASGLLVSAHAFALGECGLSCCIAGSAGSGAMNAEHLGISVQYEHSDMKTILHGSNEVSPDQVIDAHWSMGGMYSVPTEMVMEKVSLIAVRPISPRLQLMAVLPYIRNDMNMRMKNSMGMVMDMKMDTVEGLGDLSLLGFYTAYTDAPVRPTERLTLGLGLKTPTGRNDVTTGSSHFVHAMMQPGTGSWDPLFMVNYMKAFYPAVIQAYLFYHMSTESDEGYEFGDQLAIDLISRYQAADYVNLGLDLSFLHTGKDTDHDGQYARPTLSMPDNTANTGLSSLLASAVLQVKIPDTGGSLEFKYQVPLHQDVNGYQQVLDSRVMATVTWGL